MFEAFPFHLSLGSLHQQEVMNFNYLYENELKTVTVLHNFSWQYYFRMNSKNKPNASQYLQYEK